ncbi:helix-turn-helix domain-containing protein [Weissella tructae]|uniref:HTH cro/C1-type domain-containing protein n=2 Tax=Weissella TaxID=46255 RepID=A0A075U0K8_9LACO|nr:MULTISPECIES: RodZ domain-containing protein [Weissella]AIG65733.1 hypothetical protein WS08_0794 [Weissella tructae]AIM63049.1 hypothetical protein WS74_0797 [Weissella ceti]AIM64448.1 hypothetical protein WS105_0858 [Weissella ceti]ELA06814.1 hypothetical protein WCNC_04522 [Weissella ceti NC36]QVV90898.1 DUF4115 domain-containing protein [Weissella tructae]
MNEERNKQIGQDLQKVRLDKGMSLDEIQQKTRIQTRYLQAIENGQFEQLPGTFYERAFVRQFANALDLDVDAFVAEHDLVAATPSETEATLAGARVDKDHVTRAGMHHAEEGAAEKTRRVMPKVLIGIAIVTILGVIWALVVAFTGSTNTPDKKAVSVTTSSVSKPAESSSESAKSESKKESSASSSSKKEESVKLGTPIVDAAGVTYNDVQVPKDKPSTLKVEAKGDVWLQVTGTDGTVLMNDTLKSGTSQSLEIPTTMTGVTMQIGNATMLTTKLDGTDLPLKNGNVMVWRSALNFKR